MAQVLLDDKLWALIAPLPPPPKRRRRRSPGRKPLEARRALTGILFVLKTGVWDNIHHALLCRLHAADRIDWSRAVVHHERSPRVVDSASV